jgi:phosphopantothenate-cysteine ligase
MDLSGLSHAHGPPPDILGDWHMFLQHSPPDLEDFGEKARVEVAQFLQGKDSLRSKVACVTSGGTAVPLEKSAVRYIENFSRGTRGARSTEQLLEENYSVILIVRDNAEKPFETLIDEENWLDLLDKKNSKEISFKKRHEQHVKEIKTKYNHAKSQKKLLVLEYSTIFQFLKLLVTVAFEMRHLEKRALFYYAAAVSDFYIPWTELDDQKIQSDRNNLTIHLSQVPKMLGVLKSYWAPEAFHISFKLETDTRVLLPAASNTFMKYNVDMVIANELLTRKNKVTVVTKQSPDDGINLKHEELLHDLKCRHIEEQIIRRVAIEHKKHMGEPVEDENLIMQEGLKGIEARNKMEAARKKRKLGALAFDEEGKMHARNRRGGPGANKPDTPRKPSRAKTAYIFFCEDQRGKVKVEKPGMNMTEVTKTLGNMWKVLSEDQKKIYVDRGQADRERWEEENNRYLDELRLSIADIPANPERYM